MQLPPTPDESFEPASPVPKPEGEAPDHNVLPRPIAELAALSDFPQCALGKLIDIRGYVGVVVSIVHNSIKVRSPDGLTQSFNFHRLRTLYAPTVHPDPPPSTHHAADTQASVEPAEPGTEPSGPDQEVIAEPDFSAPAVPIAELARLPDYPKCALGRHVDVAGFKGVVVEIVKQSLKVRSADGSSRNYNAPLLRQLHRQS